MFTRWVKRDIGQVGVYPRELSVPMAKLLIQEVKGHYAGDWDNRTFEKLTHFLEGCQFSIPEEAEAIFMVVGFLERYLLFFDPDPQKIESLRKWVATMITISAPGIRDKKTWEQLKYFDWFYI